MGRVEELSNLSSAFNSASDGRGGIVMLGGEPGIGKTRLLEELELLATKQAALVIRGTCYEGDSTPPYWPWIQALRSVLTSPTQAVISALESRVDSVSEIVPEVVRMFPGTETAPQLEGSQARFNLFDSITSFLRELSESQPVVVILDDLHWADQSSLDLLEFFAQNIGSSPVLIVGGYRDMELSRRHPLSDKIASLARNRSFQRITVRGLNRDEVQELVESVGGIKLSPELAVEIHERTEGNPFFAGEVARDLSRNSVDKNGIVNTIEFRVPEGVREAIGIRLNRLSEKCNQVLRTASVVGREFNFDLLSKINPEFSTEDLLHLLEIADAAVVIREVHGESGRYEFAHALIQQTLNEELTTGRRLQLHAQIVGSIEELYADHIHEHYSELLHHAQEAETILGSDVTATYALLSAEQALNSYAWSDAETKFKVAYESLGSETPSETNARILFGLGKVELQTLTYPDIQRGWDKVAEAFHLFDQLGDADAAVAVAVRSRGFIPFWLYNTMPVFSRALELAEPVSSEAGTLLNLFGAAARYEEEDSEKAERSLASALVIAQKNGDRQLETGTLAELSMSALSEGDTQSALDIARQAIDLSSEHNFPLIEMYAHFISSAAYEGIGNAEKARHHAEAERSIEQRTGSVIGGAWNRYHVAYGQSARDEIDQLGDLIDSQYPTDRVVRLFVGIGAWNIGKDSNLQDRITTAQNAGRTAPNLFQKSSHAVFLALAGWVTRNQEVSAFASDLGSEILNAPKITQHIEIYSRISVGLNAAITSDSKEAATHYEALRNLPGMFAEFHFQFSSQRLLGLLAHTAGMNQQFDEHFETGLKTSKISGYKLEYAWIAHDFAERLLQSDESADRSRATAIVAAGLEEIDGLGMSAVENNLNSLNGIIESTESDSAPPQNPVGLTDREIEVLRLVAAGRTNQQIAEQLVIAQTTAAKHVANILGKTGSANRTEAATFANHHGITEA